MQADSSTTYRSLSGPQRAVLDPSTQLTRPSLQYTTPNPTPHTFLVQHRSGLLPELAGRQSSGRLSALHEVKGIPPSSQFKDPSTPPCCAFPLPFGRSREGLNLQQDPPHGSSRSTTPSGLPSGQASAPSRLRYCGDTTNTRPVLCLLCQQLSLHR